MIESELFVLINRYIPEIYKGFLNDNCDNKISAFECNRESELRVMSIHYENAKLSGLDAIGLVDLIAELKINQDKSVFIINVRNSRFFFKMYFYKDLHDLLGYVFIELRKKSEEELRWGREVLGIKKKHPDM